MESAAASVLLKSVMGRLFLVLEEEYNKRKGLVQKVESIKADLEMLAAAMDDRVRALGRRSERGAVETLYGEQVLHLAHDVEDCMDRLVHRLMCKQLQRGASPVHRLARRLRMIQSCSSFGDEIEKLRSRLEETRRRVINIPAAAAAPTAIVVHPAAAFEYDPCHAVARNPVGIEKPVEELISLLDEVEGEPEQLRVISVVGFGGSGKTTLARATYDSPQANEKFHCRAWVAAAAGRSSAINGDVVSRGIIKSILQQVRPKDAMDVDLDGQHLEASLTEYLKDKRYLIVIDDIGMEQWSTIGSTFEDKGKGSRILLTTTIQSDANLCSHGNGYVYQMSTLGEEDSKIIALGAAPSPDLEQSSATLLQKCDGLPLALVSVSKYLKSSGEPTGDLCAELCRNLCYHLKDDANFAELRKVLLDSYHNLSAGSGYALTCLMYLSMFPNDRPLKRKVVLRRWLAEGYARSDSLRSQEDVADGNLKMLIDRNIIRAIDARNNGQAKTCRAHGTMHEFVLHRALSQGFVAAISSRDHPPPSLPRPGVGVNVNGARHLCIHGGGDAVAVAATTDGGEVSSGEGLGLSRVRSLTVFGNAGKRGISYVGKCKLLRVLDLEECDDLEDEHLNLVGELWHLRYLSLGGSIRALPRSIRKLHCLETLDLRRTKIETLPVEAISLPHLAHLFGKFVLEKDEPGKLRKLLAGNNNKLQTLAGFVVNNESQGFLQYIGKMKNLSKVKIWCQPDEDGSSNYLVTDLSRAIQEFTKVPTDRASARSLSVDSEECPEALLSSLDFEPCSQGSRYDLRSLKLHGKLLQLPPFVTLLSGLTELCISSPAATLTRDLLSTLLINLGRLLYLKLIADQLEEFEMKNGSSPSLRRLCFELRSLTPALPTIEKEALPNLVSLQLLCRGLVGLSGVEIRHLKRLKEVAIDSGVTEETRQDWERAAKNHPNRPRLLLLTSVTNPMETPGPGQEASSATEKRRRVEPSRDHGLHSSLKKMKLSVSSSRLQAMEEENARQAAARLALEGKKVQEMEATKRRLEQGVLRQHELPQKALQQASNMQQEAGKGTM